MEVDFATHKTASVTRFENGREVFGDLKRSIADIDQRTTPKPPSVYKIIGLTLTIVLAGAGALWGLANRLRDRPTDAQIRAIIHDHDDAGHKSIREDVAQIQKDQGAQRVMIEDVQRAQTTQGNKLDTLLDRVPSPRKKKRRR